MATNSGYHEDDLKQRASAGDEWAFRQIFEHHHGRLFQFIFKMVKSNEVAEELVMDVFIKLWLGRDMLPEIENLNGFLFRVAYTKTIDFFRSVAGKTKFTELLIDRMDVMNAPEGERLVISKEYEMQLRNAVAGLSPKRKLIFELNEEGNLSHEEIARRLDISRQTVANTIVSARKFIKEYITKNIGPLLGLFFLTRF